MKQRRPRRIAILMVTLAFSLVSIHTVNAQSGSIILHPTDDSYTSFGDDHDSIHGNETELKVAMTLSGYNVYIYHTWLKFDLSSIPSGATGLSATLELRTCYNGVTASDTFEAYLCLNNDWSEETLNAHNDPSYAGHLLLDSAIVRHDETWYDWDVTTAVENATARNSTIISIMLRHPFGAGHDGGVWAKFDSKEVSAYAPKLTVEWIAVDEFPSILIVPFFMIATLLTLTVCKRKRVI